MRAVLEKRMSIWHPRLTPRMFQSCTLENEVELKCTKIQIEQDTHKIELKSSRLPRIKQSRSKRLRKQKVTCSHKSKSV